LEVLARAVRQEREIKDLHIEKEGIKLSLNADYMNVHKKCTKLQNMYKKSSRISEFSKITRYKHACISI